MHVCAFVVNMQGFISSICTGYLCISTCKGAKEHLYLLQAVGYLYFTSRILRHVLVLGLGGTVLMGAGTFRTAKVSVPSPCQPQETLCSCNMSQSAFWKSKPQFMNSVALTQGRRQRLENNREKKKPIPRHRSVFSDSDGKICFQDVHVRHVTLCPGCLIVQLSLIQGRIQQTDHI